MGAHLSAHGLRSLPLSAVSPPSVSTRQVLGPAQGIHSAPGYAEQIKGAWGLCAYGLRSLPLSAVVRSSVGPRSLLGPAGGFPAPAPCLLSGRLRYATPALLNARLGVGAVRLPYGLRSSRVPCPPSLPCSWSGARPCA